MNSDITVQEKNNAKKFRENAKKYSKTGCKHCCGRGFLDKSFPANERIGIPQTLTWKDYCWCVKSKMSRTQTVGTKIEVFPGLRAYREVFNDKKALTSKTKGTAG